MATCHVKTTNYSSKTCGNRLLMAHNGFPEQLPISVSTCLSCVQLLLCTPQPNTRIIKCWNAIMWHSVKILRFALCRKKPRQPGAYIVHVPPGESTQSHRFAGRHVYYRRHRQPVGGFLGGMIQEQLGLSDEQVSFFTYHGVADEGHFKNLEKALNHPRMNMEIAQKLTKTARIVAKLYKMQLEELGNY